MTIERREGGVSIGPIHIGGGWHMIKPGDIVVLTSSENLGLDEIFETIAMVRNPDTIALGHSNGVIYGLDGDCLIRSEINHDPRLRGRLRWHDTPGGRLK